ncbi:hypothetical protein BKH41_01325 [Helicobacter sp. 12S02232-10]|uniref:hypothetical protein n=1 Tax=Helicobacter sp. 12S02232-10 TaxID=1476197 RepID=UPI000BA4FBF9|nr:hypothetical protein [Helicobacter sp. 12S02232-10]PAF49967.1 hypothetical protein BKH41_01325 [Helicobacter sp. 12S02232-10]
MLHNYLKGAVFDLDSLIELTQADINDIKIANHENIFQRNFKKQELIKSFENKKNLIDQEIIRLKNKFPDKSLGELMDEQSSELLGEMKKNLQDLKELNASYARIVFAVSEFYSSLIQKIIPHEICDYKGNRTPESSFLKIQA